MEERRLWVLSTACLSRADFDALAGYVRDPESPFVEVWHFEYGVLLWLKSEYTAEDYTRMPSSVAHVCSRALAAGMSFVMFDCDAAVPPSFPTFEW